MAARTAAVVAALAALAESRDASNPLGAVLSLMNDLSAKIESEKAAEAKAYKDYFEWCDDASKNKQFEIKTAASQKAKLEATIAELSATMDACDSKISDLAASIGSGEADLSAATKIREEEAAEFSKSEAELVDVIDTIGRASTLLEREMQKNPASFAQIKEEGISGLMQSLDALVGAAAFPASDKKRLSAMLQEQQGAEDDDSLLGAPAAAMYKTHSSGIFDVLEDLKEKAEGELSDLRKAESSSSHNYSMLKQSLEDQLAADNKDMDGQKATKTGSAEDKAVAEGDLSVTVADLKSSKDALATAASTCMTVASDHEATVKARDEELGVIAKAVEILKESSGGAVSQTYSLLQVKSAVATHADLARSEVLALVKKLAREHHSPALAQLASRIGAVVKYGSGTEDVFAKVKGLISDMLAKLESEAASDATEKAYCDDELAKTEEKKSELETTIAKLSTSIDRATARSAQLKAEAKELQSELATAAKEMADAEAYRQESHDAYSVAKADLTAGLDGVRKALVVLQDYYAAGSAAAFVQQPAAPEAHAAATGAGTSIIGVLEVVESDFAETLAKEETEESDAQEAFEKETQAYKLSKAKKDQDVKYKSQEATSLDKTVAGESSDRETETTELSAVMDYYGKLKERCIAKPETYSERKARREAEIAGLKQALQILETETALVQRKGRKGRHSRSAFLGVSM